MAVVAGSHAAVWCFKDDRHLRLYATHAWTAQLSKRAY